MKICDTEMDKNCFDQLIKSIIPTNEFEFKLEELKPENYNLKKGIIILPFRIKNPCEIHLYINSQLMANKKSIFGKKKCDYIIKTPLKKSKSSILIWNSNGFNKVKLLKTDIINIRIFQ